MVAAASAAIWFDFFLTAPYEHFTITRRADIETTVLLLLVGAAVTELAFRGRRHRLIAKTDARHLPAIDSGSDRAVRGDSGWDAISDAAAQLIELLGLRGCRFERTSFEGLPRLEPDGGVRTGDTYLDVDGHGMPAMAIELRAQANGHAYGRFVLDPVTGIWAPLAARRVAVVLAGQLAAVIADQSPAHR